MPSVKDILKTLKEKSVELAVIGTSYSLSLYSSISAAKISSRVEELSTELAANLTPEQEQKMDDLVAQANQLEKGSGYGFIAMTALPAFIAFVKSLENYKDYGQRFKNFAENWDVNIGQLLTITGLYLVGEAIYGAGAGNDPIPYATPGTALVGVGSFLVNRHKNRTAPVLPTDQPGEGYTALEGTAPSATNTTYQLR